MMLRFALVLSITGCGVTDFDIDQAIPEQAVQGSPIPSPLQGIFPIPLSLDLSAQIKQMNTGPIDSVTLSSLSLSITDTDQPSGDTDDFSFVSTIQVFVKSTKDGSSLPRVEIAHIEQPGAVTTFHFKVDGITNLKPYIDEGSTVESSGTGNLPGDDVSYDGASTFTVHPL